MVARRAREIGCQDLRFEFLVVDQRQRPIIGVLIGEPRYLETAVGAPRKRVGHLRDPRRALAAQALRSAHQRLTLIGFEAGKIEG